MDPRKEEALRILLLDLAKLRVQNTPVLAPKGTARTSITGTIVLGMTETGTTALGTTETEIGPGMVLRSVSQKRSLYASSVISQATIPLVALTIRNHIKRPRSNQLSRNTTRHLQPVLRLPDQAQRRLRLSVSMGTPMIL